jgi:DNA-binding MarR family transcriptional regulator/ribosomal protein S18 acetylase RimI-like enzyme
MDRALVERVRRFSRTVTQRVGALEDRFLARDRPLGQARLLWEIGADGAEVRSLRSRLELDSGYLSRLLRALEADGLVTVDADDTDRRIRTVRLTRAGRAERSELDRRSDDVAVSILSPLTGGQRERLVAAMAEVERLLVASMVRVDAVHPRHPAGQACLRAYFAELARRFDDGFDPALSISAGEDELRPPAGLLLVATLHDQAVGCGALKLHPGAPAEIKRMWVSPTVRGLGLGRRILAELETRAAAHKATVVRLETNRTLTEAIGLYRAAGYREVPAFNDEPYAHHWFEKPLPRRSWT